MSRIPDVAAGEIARRLEEGLAKLWPIARVEKGPIAEVYLELQRLLADVRDRVWDPHVTGPATCLACGHTCQLVCHVDRTGLPGECPSCGRWALTLDHPLPAPADPSPN